MVRDRRREDALPVPHVADVGGACVFPCFRVMPGASGNIMVDEAGLEPMALDKTELLSGLSHGAVVDLRRDAGLIWAECVETG